MLVTSEAKEEGTAEARAHAVAAALGRGCRFFRDIERETGLPHGHVDRALQRLRKEKKATYGGAKIGWSLAGSGRVP